MCKRIAFCLILLAMSFAAASCIVAVTLENRTADQLIDRNVPVIRELDHVVLALVDKGDLGRLNGFVYQIVAEDPVPGEHYLVFTYNEDIDLEGFGDVVLQDGHVFLLRMADGMLEPLLREKVELMQLQLRPVDMSLVHSRPRFLADPIIQEIVDHVEADSVLSYVQRLQDYRTRYSTHDSCDAAADWVANKFLEFGCDSVFFQYHTSGHAPNVIGVKYGVVHPDSIYPLIDGHLDATSNQAPNIAPGADDNASGTVAALEAARVMNNYTFEHSVRYIAFTGEEFGLYGSEYYAAQARAAGDSIIGVINGDMIGYVDSWPESLEVLSNSANSAFGDFFIACADTYTTLLTHQQIVSSIPSDIQPFYDHGYPGVCTIEDNWPTNPHYHRTSDTIGAGFNNLAFATEGIRAEVAALAILAVPYGSANMPEIPSLVKPLDFGRLPDLQPTLSFSTTDPNGDDVQYRVLWDTDPAFGSPDSGTTGTYPSGAVADFTIPAALVNGATYWWKVKACDPGGSGYWTQYCAQRSLTIGTDLPAATCSWYQNTAAQWSADSFDGCRIEGDSVMLGGVMAFDTLMNVNFESGIPAGWTVVDGNNDGYHWQAGTTGEIGSYAPPGYGSAYAYYDDDAAGNGTVNNNEEIIAPATYTGGIDALELIYGYGFRVYQNGEKLRVKVRTYNGTWSAWSTVRVYTSSGNGTEMLDLGTFLPADSVQIEWFYSDSTASSHWGYACACDNVLLRSGHIVPFDEGTVTGSPIEFSELSGTYARDSWGDAVWTKATSADSIGIQMQYLNAGTWQLVPEAVLPGNASGFFTDTTSDTVSIAALDTITYHSLRLVGIVRRDPGESADDPALLNWEVGNLAGYIGMDENGSRSSSGTVRLNVYPTVARTGLYIQFTLADPSAPVDLCIYDAAGRRVRDLSGSAPLTAENVVPWDGTDDLGRKVATGVYFVRFITGTNVQVKKAVVVQ